MACSDIVGINWARGVLVVDSTDEVIFDPRLDISNPTTGVFIGKFHGAGETQFSITCTQTGPKTTIEFTRVRTEATTTYRGTVVGFGQRAVVGIIRGRFTRTTVQDEKKVTVNGDWETERPT